MKYCFGCGDDFLARWKNSDLAKIRVDDEIYDVCPDCVDEVLEQYRADFV